MRWIVVGGLALGLSACTEVITRTDAIANDGSQGVEYVNGTAFIHSRGNDTFVSASMLTDGDLIKVYLQIDNLSDAPIDFNERAVQGAENGRAIGLLTADDQRRMADRRDMWRRAAIGLAGGLNAASASYAGTSTYSGSVTVTDQYGHSAYGHYNGTEYNPAAAQAAIANANARTADAMANAAAVRAQEINALQGELQRTTIPARSGIKGWVTFSAAGNLGKTNQVVIGVPLGRDLHVLRFKEQRS